MRGWAVAVLAAGWLAACGDSGGASPDAGNGTEEVGSAGTTTGGDPTNDPNAQGAPNVQNVPRPEQTMAAGNLSEVNNSGVSASVNLRGIGEQTEVSLNVSGLSEGNRELQAAVVQGTCEANGQQLAQIGPIPVGAGNIAAITDTLPLPPGTVLNGEHALIVKGQNAGPSTPPLACSPLPRWQRLPPTG